MAKLSDIFNITNGSNLSLNEMILASNYDGIPFVSRTEKNNGISAFVKPNLNKKNNAEHTLTVALGGSVLETFYQATEYYTGYHIAVLSPKMKLTKEDMLFYALCIKANKIKYSYGRQANRTLKDLVVPDITEIPNWVKNKSDLICNSDSLMKENTDKLNYKLFTLGEIFDLKIAKSLDINKAVENVDSLLPLIGRTDLNNGIIKMIETPDSKYINTGNKITVPMVGSVLCSTYQEFNFVCVQNILIIANKNLNKYIAMYLIALIRKNTFRYSYGRTLTLEEAKKMQLSLPVDFEGLPSWNLMEEKIKTLEYSSSI